MDNVRKVFNAVNEELFPDGRQRPLGRSAGGHNDPPPQLQREDDNADDSEFATDEGEATDNADNESADDNADEDDAEGNSDSDADDEVSDASSDSDDMADPGAAAAAGGGAGRTKPIIPTFNGEGNNIFEISTLAQEFIDSFLGYCQHARIAQDKRLDNLDQCLTGVAKKWYRTETKFVGDFTNWHAFEAKFADRFGIELTPDARGTQAETLYIRDGELCRNFIDRCRLYQYEVSQQTKQTIARALPACNICDGCDDCPSREDKIKRITDAVSQRECIDLVIRGLEEKMREEVKKLSEGKSFDEICKIIYRLENSSTKPTKDTTQAAAAASNGTGGGVSAIGYSGRGRGGGGGGRGGGRGGGNPNTPRAAWRSKPTNRPDWVNFRDIPLDFCAVCAKKGHMADDCRVPPDRQEWDKLLKDLNLAPRQNQGSGRGGRGGGRGGNRGGGGGGAGQQRSWPPQQQPFQGNPGMYSIQQQQFLPPPNMLLQQPMTGGGAGGQCPPPTMPWGPPLGQQQQPPPAQSPAVQQPGSCGQPGQFVLDPNSQFGGTYADFSSSPFRQ